MTTAMAAAASRIDFKKLVLPHSPNFYLVCPEKYCQAKANETSRIYEANARQLYEAWEKVIKSQPRVTRSYIDDEQMQYQYIQRSLIFRFPDYINVQFIAIDDAQSTLAIFSRSKYGYSDLGVNQKRVKAWLKQLNRSVKSSEV